MTTNLCATDLKGNPDLLIKEVHIRRPIWDLKSPAHHNRDIVHKLWTEISDKLGLPLDTIKNKWKHLRDNFRTELKKTVRGSGNPPQPYQSQWTFFNDLLFLEEQMMKKISRLYAPIDSDDCNGIDQNGTTMRESTDFLAHSLFDDSSAMQAPLGWWLQNDLTNLDANNPIHGSKRKRYDYEEITMAMMNDSSLSKIKIPNSDDILDDDFHFMMSLLPFMRSLNASRKMYIRTKLQELICEFVYNIKCNGVSGYCNNSGKKDQATSTASINCNKVNENCSSKSSGQNNAKQNTRALRKDRS